MITKKEIPTFIVFLLKESGGKKICKSKFQKNVHNSGLEVLWVSDSTPEVIFDREPVQEEWTRLKWSGRTATDIRLASPSLTPKSDYWSKMPPRQRPEIPQRSAGSYRESLGIRILGTAAMSACDELVVDLLRLM